MKRIETGHPDSGHVMWIDDSMREQEGIHDEIAPSEFIEHPLEDRVIDRLGKDDEKEMQLLLRSGMFF